MILNRLANGMRIQSEPNAKCHPAGPVVARTPATKLDGSVAISGPTIQIAPRCIMLCSSYVSKGFYASRLNCIRKLFQTIELVYVPFFSPHKQEWSSICQDGTILKSESELSNFIAERHDGTVFLDDVKDTPRKVRYFVFSLPSTIATAKLLAPLSPFMLEKMTPLEHLVFDDIRSLPERFIRVASALVQPFDTENRRINHVYDFLIGAGRSALLYASRRNILYRKYIPTSTSTPLAADTKLRQSFCYIDGNPAAHPDYKAFGFRNYVRLNPVVRDLERIAKLIQIYCPHLERIYCPHPSTPKSIIVKVQPFFDRVSTSTLGDCANADIIISEASTMINVCIENNKKLALANFSSLKGTYFYGQLNRIAHRYKIPIIKKISPSEIAILQEPTRYNRIEYCNDYIFDQAYAGEYGRQ